LRSEIKMWGSAIERGGKWKGSNWSWPSILGCRVAVAQFNVGVFTLREKLNCSHFLSQARL
jgi:hypothetical protein